MPDGQQSAFDPDAFHQQFVSSQGATPFDPDEFHAKYASQAQPDAIAKQSKAAAIAAGVRNAGISTPPLKPAMEAAGAKHEANEERLDELEHRALQSPTPFTNAASVLYPAAELPGAIASAGFKGAFKSIARGAGKTAAGAGIGSGIGAGVGSAVGHPKEGAQIGAVVGGVGGPFAPDAWFSRAPYGLNRVILGEEGLADARAASKVAQRNADINAGLRKAPAVPPGPAGISTSGFRGEGLAVPPATGTGDFTATGAMPQIQIGKPPAEPIDPVVAAIKQGLASKVPTRMPKAAGAAIKQGIASASEPRSTGSEGRPATWTNETVTQLAGKGNRDAITQAIRRGLGLPENARYIAGDADYPRAVLNPREVTKFTPDGVPIRNADNPLAQNPFSRAQIAAMAKGAKAAMSSTGPQPAMPLGTPDAAAIESSAKGSIAESSGRLKQRAVPVAKQYASDIIDQAEGEMRGALELGNTMPQAGRYFAENSFEEHPLAGRYDVKAGERPGGTWSGISSQKGNIAGHYPWFNDPDISLSKLTSAIQQGKGALYERIVGKIAEGITKERGAATAAISEQIPQLRELAGQVQEIEPELAQALNDLADGKIGLAPDKLRAYVTEKISDATAAKQFAQAIDDAADEARSSSPAETDRTPDPARPGSGEAGPATQAPELSTKPPGSVKPISFGETGDSGSHIGAIEPRPLRPGETLANPPRTSNQPTYNKDEAARYRKWISGLKRT